MTIWPATSAPSQRRGADKPQAARSRSRSTPTQSRRPAAPAAFTFTTRLACLSYGTCLVYGLRQAEQLAGETDRGAVVACYYALAYVGFAAPYLAAAVGAVAGKTGALALLAVATVVLAAWTAGHSA